MMRLQTSTATIFASLLLAPLAGCADTTPSGPNGPDPLPPGSYVKSALARDLAPAVSTRELSDFTAGQRAFTFDLYAQLATEPGNLAFSPWSISSALAMAYAGAAGETASQLRTALHLTTPAAGEHAPYNALDLALNARGQGASGADGQPFRLRVVNSTWAEASYSFLDAFLDTLAVNYGAGLFLSDFLGAPEAERTRINAWVAEATEDRITDLLPEGSINSDTRLAIVNAVYFNASWATPFDPTDTRDAPFTRLDGTAVTVPTMVQNKETRGAVTADFEAVELPYDGGEVAMLFVTADDFTALEGAVDATWLAEVDAALRPALVEVHLPRFEFRRPINLVSPLQALGITDAFDPGRADFSGMDGTRNLSVAGVLHEAFIKVDERGTEAAAATAVIVGVTSVPEPMTVRLDRPFLWFIRDVATGAIVFAGRVVDPSAR